MLELARHAGAENARLKNGAAWQSTLGIDLYGKTLGIIGLGKLGKRVARIANALDMKVVAWSQNLTAEQAKEAGATLVSKEELLRTADFVTIHQQLSPRTRGLIGANGAGADEAKRVLHQHLARADRRRKGDRGRLARAQNRRRGDRRLSTRSRCRSIIRSASSTIS